MKIKKSVKFRLISIVKVDWIKKYNTVTNSSTGRKKHTPVFYTYKDIQFDIDGWADSKKFLPADFDLVLMRLKREKTIPGWIIGMTWEGLRLRKDDKVLFWKKYEDETDEEEEDEVI